MAPGRIIRLTRYATVTPTAPPANVPMKDLHNATSPKRVTQLITPSAGVLYSSSDAVALKPGIVDVFFEAEADFFYDFVVYGEIVAPGDAPRSAVLRGVLRAGGAGAGEGAVNGVLLHGYPILSLVFVRDVELLPVSPTSCRRNCQGGFLSLISDVGFG